MSTFLGFIDEIPGISIDNFEGENINSSVFFLSHCHSDHMKGLTDNFFKNLSTNNKFLYCSHISKHLLKNKHYQLNINKYLIELPLDESRIIDYVHNGIQMSITISCISAGHCPGAVMFLFTFENKRILYTGDFRINKEDFPKLRSLHYNNTTELVPLSIDKIYLDTTFLNLDFREFPNRTDSVKKLIKAVKDWIDKDPKNVVILEISALYGSELIFIELSKNLNKKIHVKDCVHRIYTQMEILVNHVTNIGESTPIHACTSKLQRNRKKVILECRSDINYKNILTIIPSAMKWAGKNTSCIIETDNVRKQTINVCYSTHSSYNELEAFIHYFKPKDINACVCDESNKTNIYELLRNIMQKYDNSFSDKYKINVTDYKLLTCNNFKSNIISDDESDS